MSNPMVSRTGCVFLKLALISGTLSKVQWLRVPRYRFQVSGVRISSVQVSGVSAQHATRLNFSLINPDT